MGEEEASMGSLKAGAALSEQDALCRESFDAALKKNARGRADSLSSSFCLLSLLNTVLDAASCDAAAYFDWGSLLATRHISRDTHVSASDTPLQEACADRPSWLASWGVNPACRDEGATCTAFVLAFSQPGVLGAWGCNIAADAIVMRRHPETKRLQVALVRRADGTDAYALPGGFVEEGELENLSQCAAREFLEEAAAYSLSTSSPAAGAEDAADGEDEAAESFTSPPAKKPPLCVYAGLVDDERNTANAWMETAAFLWVLDEAQSENIFLQAGSDAAEGSAAFYDLEEDSELAKRGVKPLENLFGSHSHIAAPMKREGPLRSSGFERFGPCLFGASFPSPAFGKK
ncbi:uncharacterized protein LOC34619468 [Cyclospora cayetanensis]|uniref:Uncharacterized protein LOC34619468 n=1 Tax=Cyclospora cayetanensis TaxID=88456 RepID=A0A6P6S5A4_9EIME|nr:uncharacterized protein LOC34619468 [Cyclospora cayetanensis]